MTRSILPLISALTLTTLPVTPPSGNPAVSNSTGLEIVRSDSCQRGTFKIALDIGHDTIRSGATSARGVTEFSYNLALGRLALSALRGAGFSETFLINEDGAQISLSRRPEIAREKGAAIFISLHHDSVQTQYLSKWVFDGQVRSYSDVFHGYAIFVSASSRWARASLSLAERLGSSLETQGLRPSLYHAEPTAGENRSLINTALGIHRFDELAVLRGATMPALLLESGVILNRDEEKAIRDGLYHPKVVAALVDAISQFCGNQ